MKNKQSKTNTHLSTTSLLSEEGQVPLPRDLSIPIVQKDDRQEMPSLPQPWRMREKKGRREFSWRKKGGQPARMIEMSSCSCSILCELPASGWFSIAQFAKTFLALPKDPEGSRKAEPLPAEVWTQGRAVMKCKWQVVHSTKTPSLKNM